MPQSNNKNEYHATKPKIIGFPSLITLSNDANLSKNIELVYNRKQKEMWAV